VEESEGEGEGDGARRRRRGEASAASGDGARRPGLVSDPSHRRSGERRAMRPGRRGGGRRERGEAQQRAGERRRRVDRLTAANMPIMPDPLRSIRCLYRWAALWPMGRRVLEFVP
jgi:hypothetical protein